METYPFFSLLNKKRKVIPDIKVGKKLKINYGNKLQLEDFFANKIFKSCTLSFLRKFVNDNVNFTYTELREFQKVKIISISRTNSLEQS